MKKIYLPGGFFLLSLCTATGYENLPKGARSAAIAGASVVLADIWSLQNNQAGLAFLEKHTVAGYYQNSFLAKELGNSTFSAAAVTPYGTVGMGIDHFGFSGYSEQKIGIAAARPFGENFAGGLQFNYHYIHIPGYGSKALFTVEAGIIAKVQKHLTIGFHLFNPGRPKVSNYQDERLPSTARAGISFQVATQVMLVTEVALTLGLPPGIRAGMEYRIHKNILLRTGFGSGPLLAATGAGITNGRLRIDLAVTHHRYLGFSPHFSLAYDL